MEITPPSSLLNTVNLARTAPEVRNWQVGQILQATVQDVPGNGLASLRIGTQTLIAQLQFPVLAGQKLSLEVTQLGDLPQLRALLSAPLQKAIEQALLKSLPRQTEHNQLLANLYQVSKPGNPVPLPPTVQQVAQSLYKALPDVQQLSNPQGIKKAIQDSGIFLESRLAAPRTPVSLNLQSDFKANLLRLYRAITQTIPPASNETANGTVRQGTASTNPQAPLTPTPVNPAVTRPPATTTPLQAPVVQEPATRTPQAIHATPAAASTAVTEAGKPLPQTGEAVKATPPQGNDTAAARPGTPLPENLIVQRQIASTLAAPLTVMKGTAQTIDSGEKAPLIPAFSLLNWKQPVPQTRTTANLSFHESLFRLMTSLLKDTDSSLARIQMNQLHSQRAEGGEQKPGWVFEIPVRRENGTDVFHFHVERDAEHKGDKQEAQDRWTVNMAFHLEELGAIHCRVSILQQDVTVLFWASQEETTRLFNQHLAELQQQLESNGLSVNKLSCLRGAPPAREDKPLQETLLNEKA